MELNRAKEIIRTLADGINPVTGEIFPPDSPYNHPDIIRALFTILNTAPKRAPKRTIEQRQQDNLAAGRPRNAGLPWTDEAKQDIVNRFIGGASITDLATHFERTPGAIAAILKRRGLIDDDGNRQEPKGEVM